MPIGSYVSNKEFTPQQREADSEHGIFQNQKRQIVFSEPNNFKFTYHYYYEYEGAGYQVVDLLSNDTVFSGTYVADGNRIILTITGGEQTAKDDVKKLDLGCKQNITGTITFEEAGETLKVVDFEIKPEKIDRITQIVIKGTQFVLSKPN